MTGKIHSTLYLMTYYSLHQDLSVNWLVVAGGIIGSYLPDADHKRSLAGKIIPLWKICKHREETHSLYFAIFAGSLFSVINFWLGIGVLTGMLAHYLGDLTTYYGRLEGLRYILYPYKNNYKKTLYKR